MPKWRPFTWVIVVINVLFLIWIIAGLSGAANNCNNEVGQAKRACEAGTAVGASIGVGIIVFFWAFVDVILGILWLVTRPKTRTCPICGNDVKRGQFVCKKCGYDFRTQAGVVPPMPPAPPGT